MSGALRIDRVVTSGTFSLDGGTWDVDNNVWVIGDDDEVVIVDAAHSASQIVDAVAGRNVVAVVVTHGHDDHVTVAPELAITLHAPVLLHPGDDMLWKASHPEERYWNLDAGQRIGVAGTEIEVIHTPIHAPQANAYAERFVRTVRGECLDWLLIVGRRQLGHVLRTYVAHYNAERPHRALALIPPEPATVARPADAKVERHDLLGGLIHEYRAAA